MKRHHNSLSQMERADVKSWARELASDVKSWKAENASWKRKAKADMRRWHAEARRGGLHLNKLAKAGM